MLYKNGKPVRNIDCGSQCFYCSGVERLFYVRDMERCKRCGGDASVKTAVKHIESLAGHTKILNYIAEHKEVDCSGSYAVDADELVKFITEEFFNKG